MIAAVESFYSTVHGLESARLKPQEVLATRSWQPINAENNEEARDLCRELAKAPEAADEFNAKRKRAEELCIFDDDRESDELLRQLLKENPRSILCNPDEKLISDGTLIHEVLRSDNLDKLKVIFEFPEARAMIDKVDLENLSPLQVAARESTLEIVRFLVGQGADINKQEVKAAGITRELAEGLSIGISRPNAKESRGKTPIMLAAANRQVDIVKYLLELAEIDLSLLDWEGRSALINATESGATSIVKELLKHKDKGLNINQATYKRFDTALIIAAASGYSDIVHLLLENGANPNLANRDGFTALHCAISEGRDDIALMLLDAGADLNARTNTGATVLTMLQDGANMMTSALRNFWHHAISKFSAQAS